MPPILANVDWIYVAILAVLVFISTWVGSLLSFKHSGRAAVLSALIFAGLFVFWTYYPHRIPGPRTLTVHNAASTPASAAPPAEPAKPAAPVAPRNPVTDITPPSPAR